jgi:hypothetical protein
MVGFFRSQYAPGRVYLPSYGLGDGWAIQRNLCRTSFLLRHESQAENLSLPTITKATREPVAFAASYSIRVSGTRNM